MRISDWSSDVCSSDLLMDRRITHVAIDENDAFAAARQRRSERETGGRLAFSRPRRGDGEGTRHAMLGGEGKVGLYRQIGIDQIGLAVEQDFLWRLVDLGDRAEQRQATLALAFCRLGDPFLNLLETKAPPRADPAPRSAQTLVGQERSDT